jgi:hypothetical protein
MPARQSDPSTPRAALAVAIAVLADVLDRDAERWPELMSAAARLAPAGAGTTADRARAAARDVLRPAALRTLEDLAGAGITSGAAVGPAVAPEPGPAPPPPGEPVRGCLRSPSDAPVAGAVVLAISSTGWIAQQAVTAADGRFELAGLPPDTYTVAVVGDPPVARTILVHPDYRGELHMTVAWAT